jgi:Protein of unknown function (DUF2917)
MSQTASIATLQSIQACRRARAGAFTLAPAQALALQPKANSSIRVTCGSAWVTLGDGRDVFLQAGQSMTAPADSRVVMESLLRGQGLTFDWQPAPVVATGRSPLRGRAVEVSLARDLKVQALRDLRGAAALLLRGLGGGFKALALMAHSSASRAQGRMASGESIASSGAV